MGPDTEPVTFVGRTEGRIVPARGPHSFGWDPVFEPEGTGQTYAEMDPEAKNKISHSLYLAICASNVPCAGLTAQLPCEPCKPRSELKETLSKCKIIWQYPDTALKRLLHSRKHKHEKRGK
eukprot:1148236-Pelagomonas_calceolata.AAC.8